MAKEIKKKEEEEANQLRNEIAEKKQKLKEIEERGSFKQAYYFIRKGLRDIMTEKGLKEAERKERAMKLLETATENMRR